MLATKQVPVAIYMHSMKKNTQVNGYRLVTHILQNIFFCAQQKKEMHTGLEQLKEQNYF